MWLFISLNVLKQIRHLSSSISQFPEWFLLMCMLRLFSVWYIIPQISHSACFSSCNEACLFIESIRENFLPHSEQTNGFSFSCTDIIWFFKNVFLENSLSQYLHLKSRIFKCVFRWTFRFAFCVNRAEHIMQWNVLARSQPRRWCLLKFAIFLNKREHLSQRNSEDSGQTYVLCLSR